MMSGEREKERKGEKTAQKSHSMLYHSLNEDYGLFLVAIFGVNAFRLYLGRGINQKTFPKETKKFELT